MSADLHHYRCHGYADFPRTAHMGSKQGSHAMARHNSVVTSVFSASVAIHIVVIMLAAQPSSVARKFS